MYIFKDGNGCIKTKIYNKRDDFTFDIVNYPFMDSNIPSGPSYGVYVSRACSDKT